MKLDLPDFHEGNLYIQLHVAAMSYLHMSRLLPNRLKVNPDGGFFDFDTDNITLDELVEAARQIANTQLEAGIETALSNRADVSKPSEWDSLHLHGRALYRHALLYTELRHSIKRGDPGRMKALFPYLLPIFKATGKHKYAAELMEVMCRWKNEWNDDLKATMLGHCLVNATGKPDGWIGIDLWQEHDVRLHKVDFPMSDSRGPSDSNGHHDISGILHTLRSSKRELWRELDVTTTNGKAKEIRTPDHILFLAREWHTRLDRRSSSKWYDIAQQGWEAV